MAEKPVDTPAEGDEKQVHIRLNGKRLNRWRRLLREEGGTEQYHAQAALEMYCATKGYGPHATEKSS